MKASGFYCRRQQNLLTVCAISVETRKSLTNGQQKVSGLTNRTEVMSLYITESCFTPNKKLHILI